jgi:lauroyl/myristoyl acyltransferase
VPEAERPLPNAVLRWGLNATAGLLHLLGRHRYRLADAAANCAFAVQPRRRATTARNFQKVLPGLDRRHARRLAARSYREYARTAMDFVYVHRLSRPRLMSAFRASGVEKLFDLQRRGLGAVLVIFHLGTWDAGGAYATALGVPLTVVMADEGAVAIRDLVIWARSEMGMHAVLASHSSRAVLAALRKGEVVALVADIPGDTPSLEVEFLGHSTTISDLPYRLAQHTGCPLMAVVAVRSPAGGYFIEVHDPIAVAPGADPQRALRPLLEVFERAVRRWPEQWYPFEEGRIRDLG